MKILVLSNFYPPHAMGGYEMVCAEVVEYLQARGAQVMVLTQKGPAFSSAEASSLIRRLTYSFPMWETGRGMLTRWVLAVGYGFRNLHILKRLAKHFRPDLFLIFNPSGLGALSLEWLHRPEQADRVVHDISDEGLLSAYPCDGWFTLHELRLDSVRQRIAQRIALFVGRKFLPKAPRPLALRHSYFRSNFLKKKFCESGLAPEAATLPVIHHGIRLGQEPEVPRAVPSDSVGLLFASRLTSEKGPHLLLQALSLLPPRATRLQVTIAGTSSDAAYEAELKRLAEALPEWITVEWVGQVSLERLKDLLRSHAVFAFPVTWDEPFSLTLLEAMAAGGAIVATSTGGSSEILAHEENCLVVERSNAEALADGILRLIDSPGLRSELGRKAREAVRAFQLDLVLQRVGRHLEKVSGRPLSTVGS